MIYPSVLTPAGIEALFEKSGQRIHVSAIIQIVEASLLSSSSDLSRAPWILQHRDHLVGEIPLVAGLGQAGVDVVCKKFRKVSDPAGNNRSSGSQIFAK